VDPDTARASQLNAYLDPAFQIYENPDPGQDTLFQSFLFANNLIFSAQTDYNFHSKECFSKKKKE